jgi:hypothetical protein
MRRREGNETESRCARIDGISRADGARLANSLRKYAIGEPRRTASIGGILLSDSLSGARRALAAGVKVA